MVRDYILRRGLLYGLEMTSISDTPEELLVYVTSHRSSSPCPQCAMPSSAIHSSYHRHPRDLPCIGRPIRLVFTVRKFFCRNPQCSRKVFTERLPDFIEASSRLTKRLRAARFCDVRQGWRTSE
jgi:transposase